MLKNGNRNEHNMQHGQMAINSYQMQSGQSGSAVQGQGQQVMNQNQPPTFAATCNNMSVFDME